MAIPKPVKRQGSDNYYIRKMVPHALRDALGKREFWVSLGTPDLKKAEAGAPRVLAEVNERIEAAQRRTAPSAADLIRAIGEFARRELAIDLNRRSEYVTQADFDREEKRIYTEMSDGPALDQALSDLRFAFGAPERHQWFRHHYEVELRKHLARGEIVLLRWAADEIIEKHGYIIAPLSEPYRALCHDLMKAHLDVLQVIRDRDSGNFASTTPYAAEPEAAKPKLTELFKLYEKDAAGRISPHTIDQYGKFVGLFADYVGDPATTAALTKANLREWKLALEKWPVKATEKNDFKGKSFREIVAEVERRGNVKTITKRTVEKHIRALGAFSAWLVAQDYIDRNPTHGLMIGTKKPTHPVRSFTPEELTRIFTSPVFTGCKTAKIDHKLGTAVVRDWRYWLPLVGLFTGARLGEIGQLMVADIRQAHGTWIFHLTEEGEGEKTLKTAGSQRVVPVHSMLVRLGLLEYWAKVKQAGNTRLFPEIRRDTRGHFSGDPSRWFGRYLRRVKIKTGREIKFHSFRHTFIDALRRADFVDEEFGPLLGHAKATMTGRYGNEKQGTIALRARMVEAVAYDLDLSHLLPANGEVLAAE